MRAIRTTVFGFLAVFGLAVAAQGQALPTASPEEAGLSAEVLDRIGPALQKYVDDGEVAGVVTLVARRGKVVRCDTLGWMDVDAKRPMQRDTIFRIYSMTKPVTSVAAMMLVEEGKLQLDAPVSKYIPQFANLQVVADPAADEITTVAPKRAMTVRDLMRHTAGLSYGHFGSTAVDKLVNEARARSGPDADLEDLIDDLSEIPLLYQPGTKWHYSLATDVLGYIVEKVSGQELDKFFRARIFRPLGMNDTGFFVPKDKLDRLATNYRPKLLGGLAVLDSPATSQFTKRPAQLSGGGGLVSTADDYMRFCLMLLGRGEFAGRRLLNASTVEMMTANQLPEPLMPIAIGPKRPGVGFGLGFAVRVDPSDLDPSAQIGEYGWGGAASTHFWISPRDEIAVVALEQYMPYSDRVARVVKPIVYEAMVHKP